jgi:L-alanine-DL-glutamate epimerase-like enolase superfamily enzyme
MTSAPIAPVQGLHIDRIEAIKILAPLSSHFGVSSFSHVNKACVFVRVFSDGVVGETYAEIPENLDGLVRVQTIIDRDIAPNLVGQDAGGSERVWKTLLQAVRANPPHSEVWARMALGLVDAALWDLRGKALRQPLWRLWGGHTSGVPVLHIGGYYGTDLEEEIDRVKRQQFGGMKFKVGGRTPAEDAARVETVRELCGPGLALAPDANCGWTFGEALDFARRVAGLGIAWFEEPSSLANRGRDWREIRTRTAVSVCGGQNEIHASTCLDLMVGGAMDVCNYDAVWGGGPTEWLRVSGIAHALNCTMAHHQQPQIGLHLIAAVAHGTFGEIFAPDRDPVWWKAVTNRPPVEGGVAQLSSDPGYGWSYDWDWLKSVTVR